MASDLSPSSDDDDDDAGGEPAPKKGAAQILKHEIGEGLHALEMSTIQLFFSALSGGMDVGFSVLLMAVAETGGHQSLPAPVVSFITANMYAVGFVFVILGRSELFTEQTSLAVLPVLRGKASIAALLRLWAVVYIANILGAAASAGLISYIAPHLHAASVESFGHFGHRMTDHPRGIVFLSAVLAGWLMGLLSWMVSAARDTISQIAIIWMVTASIGLAGLHHSIVGTVEVLAAVFAHTGITMGDFGRFLLWATLGNAVGGSVFVALVKYAHANPRE